MIAALCFMVHRVIETVCGVWALVVLGFKTGFRLRGSYWKWRYETAFGSEPNTHITRRQRFIAMIEYGKWVHRMNRYR